MISLPVVKIIHAQMIDRYGGSHGIRDLGLLESALARPFATFDGVDLYPTPEEKAAALLESILINHPFIDGNKRTAYALMRMLLLYNGCDIIATREEKYEFIIAITEGKYRIEGITEWIVNRSVKR